MPTAELSKLYFRFVIPFDYKELPIWLRFLQAQIDTFRSTPINTIPVGLSCKWGGAALSYEWLQIVPVAGARRPWRQLIALQT